MTLIRLWTSKHIRRGQERHAAAAEERESRQQQAKTVCRVSIFSLCSWLIEDLFPPNQRVRIWVMGILKRLHKTDLVSFILSTPSLNHERLYEELTRQVSSA